jgi:hypothetical protein
MNCLMDSYLHLYIRDIKKLNIRADLNIRGTNDITCRVQFQGWVQDTKICRNEAGTTAFDEPIILENARPAHDQKQNMLIVSVYDFDTMSGDDKLCEAYIPLPMDYGKTVGVQDHELKRNGNPNDPKMGETVGTITIEQIHFIKQKVRRYMGPCKPCFACCCETGQKKP